MKNCGAIFNSYCLLLMNETADVVVIGGGVMGTSIAWNLAKRGARQVALIERDGIAAGATGKSSAIIRTHYTHEVLARMALRARGIFENFDDVVGGEAGFTRTGFIIIVSPKDVETARNIVDMNHGVGITAQVMMLDELAQHEPRMNIAPEITGAAVWEPDSGFADPHLTACAFGDAARRAGVKIRTGICVAAIRAQADQIQGVETDHGFIETRTVVVAAGYRTRDLLAPFEFDAPVTPVRHTMAILKRTDDFGVAHPVISDRVLGEYLRPDVGDLTLVGTTAPFDGVIDYNVEDERGADEEHLHELAHRFWQRFPTQGEASLRGGFTGIYDCSADLQPLLGPIPNVEGLFIACGFSGHGFKLSPVVGELMAEKILQGKTTLVDIDFFNPARFIENRPIKMQYAYSVTTL